MNKKLAIAVRAALAGSGVIAALHAVPSYAQDASVEEIMITGTRVRGVEPVGTSVLVMDRGKMACRRTSISASARTHATRPAAPATSCTAIR
jgi:hypothetical protein